MSALTGLKAALCSEIDCQKEKITEIAHRIHEHPELGLQEYFASDLLCSFLSAKGFLVKKGLADLETSFRADYDSGIPGPRIALIAEYDALPGIGHGCGHNIIGACAVGAAAALAKQMPQIGGSICVIGAPAEETVG